MSERKQERAVDQLRCPHCTGESVGLRLDSWGERILLSGSCMLCGAEVRAVARSVEAVWGEPDTGTPIVPVTAPRVDERPEREEPAWRVFRLTFNRTTRVVYTQDGRLSTQVVQDLRTQFPQLGVIRTWHVSTVATPDLHDRRTIVWDGTRTYRGRGEDRGCEGCGHVNQHGGGACEGCGSVARLAE
jgi:hypothetical protein